MVSICAAVAFYNAAMEIKYEDLVSNVAFGEFFDAAVAFYYAAMETKCEDLVTNAAVVG